MANFESIHFQSLGRQTTNASKPEVLERLRSIVGDENVVVDPTRVEPYGADAVKEKFPPEAVVFPESTAQMVDILKLANEYLFSGHGTRRRRRLHRWGRPRRRRHRYRHRPNEQDNRDQC